MSNPGGLRAEGHYTFFYDGEPHPAMHLGEADADEKTYPTLAAERSAIVTSRAEANSLRPLLTREPRPEDIPALQAVVHERHRPRPTGPLGITELQNVVSEMAQERLAELHAEAN